MESTTQSAALLDLLSGPAFLVRDDKVIQVNSGAQAYHIEPGQSVAGWLGAAQEEYRQFSGGSLYLQLQLPFGSLGAAVSALGEDRLFVLEELHDPRLQALALAAVELRQPLSGIMALASKAFPAAAKDAPEDTREQLSMINRNLYQLLRIISNMSDADRFAAEGSRELELQDLKDVLTEIFEKAEHFCADAGVPVSAPKLPDCGICAVDADLLERAIFNLLANALKYRSENPVIEITAKRISHKLMLTFRDNGRGFGSIAPGNLCSQYLRRPGLDAGEHGIGLGLVLVRSAAAIHGGTLLFRQEQGFTEVTLTLSLAPRTESIVRSSLTTIDYAGEFSHGLLEFSELLPPEAYQIP